MTRWLSYAQDPVVIERDWRSAPLRSATCTTTSGGSTEALSQSGSHGLGATTPAADGSTSPADTASATTATCAVTARPTTSAHGADDRSGRATSPDAAPSRAPGSAPITFPRATASVTQRTVKLPARRSAPSTAWRMGTAIELFATVTVCPCGNTKTWPEGRTAAAQSAAVNACFMSTTSMVSRGSGDSSAVRAIGGSGCLVTAPTTWRRLPRTSGGKR